MRQPTSRPRPTIASAGQRAGETVEHPGTVLSIRVLLADDEPLVRTGISLLLSAQPDIEIIAELADGEAAVAAVLADPPDVAVLDIRMPGLDGVAATRQIMAAVRPGPPVNVLILTTFGGDDDVYQALRAGAAGYLLKDHAPAHLVAAVRSVSAGQGWLDTAVTRAVIRNISTQPVNAGLHHIAGLTERERDVLLLLAQGGSNAEIAVTLGIGIGTVKTHVSHVLTKLGLRDRTQAAGVAYRAGLL